MTFNAMTEHYEEITVCGKPALFTGIRIRRDTVPDGLYPETCCWAHTQIQNAG